MNYWTDTASISTVLSDLQSVNKICELSYDTLSIITRLGITYVTRYGLPSGGSNGTAVLYGVVVVVGGPAPVVYQ